MKAEMNELHAETIAYMRQWGIEMKESRAEMKINPKRRDDELKKNAGKVAFMRE